ncbi:MAG: LemA family protein [Firmicutes bacterium HGW-Firmicutes-14]|nr:MAG: LemA family protein [Firmicutes bacterium HGW-Firmicutes-14]
MKGKLIIIGLLVVLLLVVFSGFGSYNSLVALDEEVNTKWSDLGSQLQRRNDLIPNLVETVKGYSIHEQDVLKNVSDARAKLGGARTLEDQVAGQSELSGALSRLLMVVENYPNLKADSQFTGLRDELAGTENRINIGRMDYNQAVRQYNQRIRSFPTLIYAGLFGFDAKPYFEVEEGAEDAPKVDFGTNK